MKKLLLLLIIVFGACASTQPVVYSPIPTPPIPMPPARDTIIYKYDTIRKIDTIRMAPIFELTAFPITSQKDSGWITLFPSGGDDQPQIQAAVSAHLHTKLIGHFLLYSPVIVFTWNGTDYGQSWCDIEGQSFAQNTNGGYITTVTMMYDYFPAFIIQQGKGCVIKNIQFQGQYNPPIGSPIIAQQNVSSFRRSQWRTTSSDIATAPHAAIVIDAFSDPKYLGYDSTKGYKGMWSWYVSGMSQSGSTAIQISGCNFQNFNVCILITAVNQYNGESIKISDCGFGNCMSDVASTQAQAKNNLIFHCMAWGPTHTIIDGVYYGITHYDAATVPDVVELNTAGMNYQFVACDTRAFPAYFSRVDAENITSIGWTGLQTSAGTLVDFDKCRFEFVNGGNSPAYWYHGANTSFDHCVIRYYNGGNYPQQRIVLNDYFDQALFCSFGALPVVVWGPVPYHLTYVVNPYIEYGPQAGAFTKMTYDSIVQSPNALLRVNGVNAYYLSSDTSGLEPGSLIFTAQLDPIDSLSLYHPFSQVLNYQMPLGYFDHFSPPDTVFLDNIERDQVDSSIVSIYKALYKKQ